jgi:hypothetical protein
MLMASKSSCSWTLITTYSKRRFFQSYCFPEYFISINILHFCMQISTFLCEDFPNLLTVKMRTIVVFIGAISLPKYTKYMHYLHFCSYFRSILREIAIRPKNKAYSQEVNPIVELSDIYQKKFAEIFFFNIFWHNNIFCNKYKCLCKRNLAC